MAAQKVLVDSKRLIDTNGIADGGNIFIYLTGTTTKVNLFSNAALSTSRTNPVVVPAGAQIPLFYYDDAQTVRI